MMGYGGLKKALLAGAGIALCVGCAKPPAQPAFKAEVKYAQVGDVKLAYYVRGEGKPLLMINGYVSTMSRWDPMLVDELSRNRQLILFDNRGVGLSSDTAADNTSIPQMADDAAGLINALGLDKPDILGWSMGARIGQQLLIRHPESVGKAVLAAPNPGGSRGVPADKAVEDKLNNPDVALDQKLALLVPAGPGEEAQAEEIYQRILNAGKQGTAPDDFTVSRETALRQNRARTTLWNADESNFENLKNIKNPVLLTDGRDDVIDKPSMTICRGCLIASAPRTREPCRSGRSRPASPAGHRCGGRGSARGRGRSRRPTRGGCARPGRRPRPCRGRRSRRTATRCG